MVDWRAHYYFSLKLWSGRLFCASPPNKEDCEITSGTIVSYSKTKRETPMMNIDTSSQDSVGWLEF